MPDMFSVHYELTGVTSALALKAANAAWYAMAEVIGEENIQASAERRDADGNHPRETGWRGWREEVTSDYYRRPR